MVQARKGSTAATNGTGPASAVPSEVLAAADDVVTASQASVTALPKKTRRKIRKLAKDLDAARATEAKRLRQATRAQLKVDKRQDQAAAAAAEMATIIGLIRDKATSAASAVSKPTATPPAKPATTKTSVRLTPPPKPLSRRTSARRTTKRATPTTRRKAAPSAGPSPAKTTPTPRKATAPKSAPGA
jgi:hypothetical protein